MPPGHIRKICLEVKYESSKMKNLPNQSRVYLSAIAKVEMV
jgi:hypothetical protein